MINNTILEYISTERARGVNDIDIRSALRESGWKEEDITIAFAGGQEAPDVASASSSRIMPAFSFEYLSSLFSGRIGRKHYARSLVYWILSIGFGVLGVYTVMTSGSSELFGGAIILLVIIAYVCTAITIQFSLLIRRLHDLDHSGWWSVLILVSGLNLIFYLYALLASGTPGVNRFGKPE